MAKKVKAIEVRPESKVCLGCWLDKPLTEYHNSRGGKWGLKSRCKDCLSTYSKTIGPAKIDRKRGRDAIWQATDPEGFAKELAARKARQREWERETQRRKPNKKRAGILMAKYGLTLEAYDEMLVAQGGVCGICGKPSEKGVNFDVDHCHVTGQVRGLIDRECNLGLGKFRDSPILIAKALAYLLRAERAESSNDNGNAHYYENLTDEEDSY